MHIYIYLTYCASDGSYLERRLHWYRGLRWRLNTPSPQHLQYSISKSLQLSPGSVGLGNSWQTTIRISCQDTSGSTWHRVGLARCLSSCPPSLSIRAALD